MVADGGRVSGWRLSDDNLGLEVAGYQPAEAKLERIRLAFEQAGVIFAEENGEEPGVRLKKGVSAKDAEPHHGKSTARDIRRRGK